MAKKCACGCGRPVTRKSRRGPEPDYHSSACRVAAYRRRHAPDQLEPLPDAVRAVPAALASGPVDEQVARAVLEARGIGFAFDALARRARPEFAWRCAKLGKAIGEAVVDAFGEAAR